MINHKLYLSKRPGAAGALMDLYEQEAALLFETVSNKVFIKDWVTVKDVETKDADCRSIQSICQHLIEAAQYYVELFKKGENPTYTVVRKSVVLSTKNDFETQFRAVLKKQAQCFGNRWAIDNTTMETIKIKTNWGNILDWDGLLEHAVMHVMRHHRQILKFIDS